MWVDPEAEVRTRMRDRARAAERRRMAAHARASGARTRRPAAGYGWWLRQAVGHGLVRTGLRLLDARRA